MGFRGFRVFGGMIWIIFKNANGFLGVGLFYHLQCGLTLVFLCWSLAFLSVIDKVTCDKNRLHVK